MTVTLLCPGPSLAHLSVLPNGLILGVNRAPHCIRHLGRVDWWVYAEARIPQTYPLDYSPRVFTTQGTRDLLNLDAPTFESLSEPYDHKTGWRCFSATAALILAAELGAKRIDVYGADMAGTKDADGHEYNFPEPNQTAANLRNPERWDSERVVWRKTCELIAGWGVTVNRILPIESVT